MRKGNHHWYCINSGIKLVINIIIHSVKLTIYQKQTIGHHEMILLSMNCSIITFKYSFQVSKKRNKRCKDWQFLILSYIKDRLLKTSKSVGFARCLREGICHRDLIIDCFYKNILWLLPCPNLLFNFHLFNDHNLFDISYTMLFISSKNSQHNQSYNVSKFSR